MTTVACTPSRQIPSAAPDYAAIKQRQQATWASGDFAVIGTTLQAVGESLAEAADIRAGERVLDVAAGNGNATLAAARRFAKVTSTDYVSALLDKGRTRATAEGLQVDFQIADAEDLPFEDGSFDAVLSTFGAMFTPDHTRPAREMLRVVRNGGRIGLANWTPEGFIGQLFKVIGAYIPAPAGLKSPALWGTEPHIVELFGAQATDIRTVRRNFNFRYRSAAHWLQVFRDFYGPTHKAFAALDPAGQDALAKDITALLNRCNTAGPASLVVPAEYLEVVITKHIMSNGKAYKGVASTKDVVARHLQSFGESDLKGILSDYAPGAVLFTPNGPLRGADAMRPFFQALIAEFGKPGSAFSVKQQYTDGDYAYILWTAETADNVYEMATDTFVVRDGKIVAQSFAGKITPKG